MFKKILFFLWQLPQNFLGALILLVNLKSRKKGFYLFCTDSNGNQKNIFITCDEAMELCDDIGVVHQKIPMYTVKHLCGCGISLGKRIIIDSDSRLDKNVVRHEYGHQKQSLYLGWLYLVVIGLPSLCGNIIDRVFHKKWTKARRIKWYYSQPWEKWADSLGGVGRWMSF